MFIINRYIQHNYFTNSRNNSTLTIFILICIRKRSQLLSTFSHPEPEDHVLYNGMKYISWPHNFWWHHSFTYSLGMTSPNFCQATLNLLSFLLSKSIQLILGRIAVPSCSIPPNIELLQSRQLQVVSYTHRACNLVTKLLALTPSDCLKHFT